MFPCQAWVDEEGHSLRREVKGISSDYQGRWVFGETMEALVRRCPGQRRSEKPAAQRR